MAEKRRVKYAVAVSAILVVVVSAYESFAQPSEVHKASECPEIIVTGPSGVSTPGDLIRFFVELKPEPKLNLLYEWSTSAGKVNEGQSTKSIGVRYLMEMRGTSLIATVKVSGLPSECKDSGSDVAPLTWDPGPELLSEFSISIARIHHQNLRKAADEQKNDPNVQIYIIEYFRPGTSVRSINLKKNKIMTFMVKTLKIYGPAVTIVTAEAYRPYTRIYCVPPGASNPMP